MTELRDVAAVALVGLGTTSSSMVGAAVGLYLPLSKKILACTLAFAAGALISALAIDLGFGAAIELRHSAFSSHAAWAFVGGGFAIGAVLYYCASRYLERRGAAVRFPARFREYALHQKRSESHVLIKLLSECDILRHLPAEEIEQILRMIKPVKLSKGGVLFRAGDVGDALFIVATGSVEVVSDTDAILGRLGEGQAFGEMALLNGGLRTATVRGVTKSNLLKIDRVDFDRMVAADDQLARAVQRLSHDRALKNLTESGQNAKRWAKIATSNVQILSRGDSSRLLTKASDGAGIAIVLGNVLDTIPGCLVIGAKFDGLASLSMTLILGMFVGGVPEAAASAAILRKAGYGPAKIFGLWSTVLLAGVLAAIVGKVAIGSPDSIAAVFSQAIAGGAVLALVAHAMIPEAIHDGGSLVVLPTVAGFLFVGVDGLRSVKFCQIEFVGISKRRPPWNRLYG